jgi:hypothetical protein
LFLFFKKKNRTWFKPKKPGLNRKTDGFFIFQKNPKAWFEPEKPGLNQKKLRFFVFFKKKWFLQPCIFKVLHISYILGEGKEKSKLKHVLLI